MLLYHHQNKDKFRVLALHQSGEIVIKAKKYKSVRDFINDNSTKIKYPWMGRDFLRI